MWQVLRFLYFHQSVYIYLSLAQSLLPPPCYLPFSYFVCAHVLRTRFFRSRSRIEYRTSMTRFAQDSMTILIRATSYRNYYYTAVEILLAIFGQIYYRYLWCSFVTIVSSFSLFLVSFIKGEGGRGGVILDPLDDTSLTLKFVKIWI